jgi:hypothetical protein
MKRRRDAAPRDSRPWTAEDEALLGTMPDEALAAAVRLGLW